MISPPSITITLSEMVKASSKRCSERITVVPSSRFIFSSVFKNSPALLHIDATQSFLKYDIFPRKLGIDLLTVSAHKIYAPKGVGALYIKKGVRIKPITFGGEQFSSLRPGTEPTLLIAGFGGAIDEKGYKGDGFTFNICGIFYDFVLC